MPTDRENILAERRPSGQPRVIFDEIYKYARWRNLMKGLFDKNRSAVSFIVTGSARLDYYRKGGDSLRGRYHYYRLHPFTATPRRARLWLFQGADGYSAVLPSPPGHKRLW